RRDNRDVPEVGHRSGSRGAFSLEFRRALGQQRRRLEGAVRPDLPLDDDLDLLAEDVGNRAAPVVDRHLAAAVVDPETDRESCIALLARPGPAIAGHADLLPAGGGATLEQLADRDVVDGRGLEGGQDQIGDTENDRSASHEELEATSVGRRAGRGYRERG